MNGVLNFYKEKGISSFQASDKVRRLFGISKCGHLGTLDPMAEGVLPLCLGYAARFADYLSSADKEYIAGFRLGIATDSFDITGTVISESSIKPDYKDVLTQVENIIGEKELVVPAFSAKKINGIRAYKLARDGKIENAGLKTMVIYSSILLKYEYPECIIRVKCGKGTYIRSIISEIGNKLGCGAVMTGLVRSANGQFLMNNAYRYSELEDLKNKGMLESSIIPVVSLLNWAKAVVREEAISLIKNGVSPEKSAYYSFPIEADGSHFFIMDTYDKLLAVAVREENSNVPLKVKMVFI